MLGRNRLRSTFVTGSKTEYETKKMVRVALYWFAVIPSCLLRPSILALPMLVLFHVSADILVAR